MAARCLDRVSMSDLRRTSGDSITADRAMLLKTVLGRMEQRDLVGYGGGLCGTRAPKPGGSRCSGSGASCAVGAGWTCARTDLGNVCSPVCGEMCRPGSRRIDVI